LTRLIENRFGKVAHDFTCATLMLVAVQGLYNLIFDKGPCLTSSRGVAK
jgi:hypothetical protein